MFTSKVLSTTHQRFLRPATTKSGSYSRILDLFYRSAAHAHRTKYKMGKAYLRNAFDSPELHISFRYKNDALKIDRDFNFCRNINEKVDDALARIRTNVEKEVSKKLKKRKQKKQEHQSQEQAQSLANQEKLTSVLNEDAITFTRNGNDRISNVTFAEMLSDQNDLHLNVVDQTYEIVVNLPWVVNLVLPTSVLAGYKIYPSKVEMQFAEREHSCAVWCKAKMPNSKDLQSGATWFQCGDGLSYDTTNDDIDYFLKLVLTPGNKQGRFGPPVEAITKHAVQAGPGICPFETRHCFTKNRLSGSSFRVVSYNLLADLYADSDYSRLNLFPYCPPYALRMDYRKQLFIKEIIGYNADIICLQEVDIKIFDHDLKPVLASKELSYTGLMEKKGSSGEGIAIFFRNDRFELNSTQGINIGDNVSKLPEFAPLWQKINQNEKLVARLCDRATTLQLSVLKCKETDSLLLVVNTHLYFHPDADHIRLLQIGFAMIYVEHIYNRLKEESDNNIAIIFCGDFNSVPECGIYKLMTERFVDHDFIDWSSNQEEAVTNVSLSQPFTMKSACGTPLYTNYTHAFAACLDYIFYQCDKLDVEQVIPLPNEEDLKSHIAIPSVVFPSDHVALVADLKFK